MTFLFLFVNFFVLPIISTFILLKKTKFFYNSMKTVRVFNCYIISFASVFSLSLIMTLLIYYLFDCYFSLYSVGFTIVGVLISLVIPFIYKKMVQSIEDKIIRKKKQQSLDDTIEEENKSNNNLDTKDESLVQKEELIIVSDANDKVQEIASKKPIENHKKTSKAKTITLYVLVSVCIILSYLIISVTNWSKCIYTVTFYEILITITSPVKGASAGVVIDALKYCVPRVLVFAVVYGLVLFVCIKYKRKNIIFSFNFKKIFKVKLNKIINISTSIICVLSFVCSILYVENTLQIVAYFKNANQVTTIYEDYYVNPNDVNIQYLGEKKKNLIHIYLESMETTYASKENGGAQNDEYIPNLVNLANNNISFSNSSGFGGFKSVHGTTNTMMALFGITSGVPYEFPIINDTMYNKEYFATGLTTIGDVLNDFGYKQKFVCGSKAEFGGRDEFFKQHGNYDVVDYDVAKEKGYIPKDYYVWWGYEDQKLYDIAKTELTDLASQGEPFNFTLLTVDTHFFKGYHCPLCDNFNNEEDTANIVSCADMQIYNFIEWCKTQDFYEDSVIVITGDHLRMDSYLVKDIGDYNRTVYNCFINCEKTGTYQTTNRVSTSIDMFPTMLSALGFTWEGNRLGLGTNLFSEQQTIAEEIGYGYFNSQLSKRSQFYIDTFS